MYSFYCSPWTIAEQYEWVTEGLGGFKELQNIAALFITAVYFLLLITITKSIHLSYADA